MSLNSNTTDVIIIGAGPAGLFAGFQAGLNSMSSHLIDNLGTPGGQCAEVYPKKPIYDIPGFPSVVASELVDNLVKQVSNFNPEFTLGERVEEMSAVEGLGFRVVTNKGTEVVGKAVVIAAGNGCFEPRKPDIPSLSSFEDKGVDYIVRNPEKFQGRSIVIGGGGDSAFDWAIILADIARDVSLIHRSSSFRAAPDSIEKARDLELAGRIKIVTDANVVDLHGEGSLSAVTIRYNGGDETLVAADYFLPLFGLSPKLGPIANWGVNIQKNSVVVNNTNYMTSMDMVYAIGDVADYPNKLKLILCGFHEAAVVCHDIYRRLNPNKSHAIKYTTVSGLPGVGK